MHTSTIHAAYTHIHTQTHTQTYKHTHTTHTHTHTNTHTHTHTHTHLYRHYYTATQQMPVATTQEHTQLVETVLHAQNLTLHIDPEG